jgi:hypothetical protein
VHVAGLVRVNSKSGLSPTTAKRAGCVVKSVTKVESVSSTTKVSIEA